MKRTPVLIDGAIFGLQSRGGVSRFAIDLLSELANHSDLNVNVRLPAQLLRVPPPENGITYIRDSRFSPWRLSVKYNAWSLRCRCRRQRVQVFHSIFYEFPPLQRMRTVISVYDMIHEKFSDMLNDSETIRQKEQVISGADVLVALSSQTRDDLVNMMGIQPERVRVIYPGLTRDFVGNMSTSYDAEWQRLLNITGPYWLHVGCRRSYKNFSVLLRAFVSVAHDTDCFLVVVGGEPDLQPDEILLLERHDCRQRVRLVSDVDDAVLQAMYSQAIAFVSCSLGEGFGLTLLEAMACSAPVVASDIPVFHEVVGDAGLYFDPLDSGMLAGRLLESLKATTREDCRNKGQQRLPLFSWEKAANDYAQVYHEVAES